MKHKKILLVANDNREILNVQRELTRHNVDHSLHVAKNGLDALALLMGCSSPQMENYSKTGKVQPDIILMDVDSPGMHAIDLLCIMQKYYSLQKIRVFLLAADPNKIDLPEAERCGITGVLGKPFNFTSTLYDAEKLKEEFKSPRQKAWLPLLAGAPLPDFFAKWVGAISHVKYIALQTCGTFGAKTAVACTMAVAGTLMSASIAGDATYNSKNISTVTEKPSASWHGAAEQEPVIEDPRQDEIEPETSPEPQKPEKKQPRKKISAPVRSVVTQAAESRTVREFKILVVEAEDEYAATE